MKGKYMLTDKFKVDNLKFVESELDTQYLNKGGIKNDN